MRSAFRVSVFGSRVRFPKRPRYCYGGILSQITIAIPNMETLHSTI